MTNYYNKKRIIVQLLFSYFFYFDRIRSLYLILD